MYINDEHLMVSPCNHWIRRWLCMCRVVRQEEEYDHRSLYERLKSQKDKVDADKAEQFKFSKL